MEIIVENGKPFSVLRDAEGNIYSWAAAQDVPALGQIEKQQVADLLKIDPQAATNEEIVRLLQFVVRKLV